LLYELKKEVNIMSHFPSEEPEKLWGIIKIKDEFSKIF
jgi:hypothetical protein